MKKTIPLWLAAPFLCLPLLTQLSAAQTPTLIVAPGTPHADAPPTLIGGASAHLSASKVTIGSAATTLTLTLPAGANPSALTASGGAITAIGAAATVSGRVQVPVTVQIAGGQGGKMTVTDPASGLSVDLFNPTFDFSSPPASRQISSAVKGNIFVGTSAILTFPNSDNLVTGYEVRNIRGVVVASGSISAGQTSVSPSLTTYGWYSIRLTRDIGQAQYGNTLASTVFSLTPPFDTTCNLPPLPAKSAFVSAGRYFTFDMSLRGWIQGAGPERVDIADAARYQTDLADAITTINAQKTYYVLGADGTLADPVRGRPMLVNFPQGIMSDPRKRALLFSGAPDLATRATAMSDADYQAAARAGVAAVVAALYPLGVTTYEAANEPGVGAGYVPASQLFAAGVHQGNANALAIGPAGVSLTGGVAAFYAGGGTVLDGYSGHPYNAVNGDYNLGETTLTALDAIRTQYGQQNKPAWNTEQGYAVNTGAVVNPFRAAQWPLVQTMVFERHSTPYQQSSYWYMRAQGFWAFPNWLENSDGSANPGAPLLRRFAEETWESPFAASYDFGADGNAVWYGNRFDGQQARAGQSVSVFAGKGTEGQTLTLAVSGTNIPATFDTQDAWGNPLPIPVIGGTITLPVSDGLLRYVHHPSTVTLTPTGLDWGNNLALNQPVYTPTKQAYTSVLTNGLFENSFGIGGAGGFSSTPHAAGSLLPDGTVMTKAETFSLPYTLTLDLDPVGHANKTVGRVVVASPPGWQFMPWITSATVSTGTSEGVFHVDGSAGTVLTGTVISDSGGPLASSPAYAAANAFDGNPATPYIANNAANTYVGLDLGTAMPLSNVTIQSVSGQTDKLNGSVVEGSNTSATTGYVPLVNIGTFPTSATSITWPLSGSYRWVRLREPARIAVNSLTFRTGVASPSVNPAFGFTQRAKVTQPGLAVETFSDQRTFASHVWDYPPIASTLVFTFPPTTARFVKITVYGVTNGGDSNPLVYNYGGQGGDAAVYLSEIQAFAR